jgi:hypothetical protein
VIARPSLLAVLQTMVKEGLHAILSPTTILGLVSADVAQLCSR